MWRPLGSELRLALLLPLTYLGSSLSCLASFVNSCPLPTQILLGSEG